LRGAKKKPALLRASFQCNASFNRSSSPCYLRGAEQSASAICKVPACDQCMVLQGGALENSTAERSIAQFFVRRTNISHSEKRILRSTAAGGAV